MNEGVYTSSSFVLSSSLLETSHSSAVGFLWNWESKVHLFSIQGAAGTWSRSYPRWFCNYFCCSGFLQIKSSFGFLCTPWKEVIFFIFFFFPLKELDTIPAEKIDTLWVSAYSKFRGQREKRIWKKNKGEQRGFIAENDYDFLIDFSQTINPLPLNLLRKKRKENKLLT